MTAPLAESRLPLPLLRRGKVREVYEVDADASAARRQRPGERVRRRHARADPAQGRGAHPDERVLVRAARRRSFPSHYVTARADEIVARVPALAGHAERDRGPRDAGAADDAGAVRVRGARLSLRLGVGGVPAIAAPWPASRCRPGCARATRLDPPLFSPATKAETGHDENITFDAMADGSGPRARRPGSGTRASPSTAPGATTPPPRGIIIADTKFEFGTRRRRHAAADRRGADARQLALLAGRPLRAGPDPAQLRQAAAARLPRRASGARAAGTARRRRRRCRPRWSRRPAGATSRRSGCITGRALEDAA